MTVKYPTWINKIEGSAQTPEEMNGIVEVLQNHAETLSLHDVRILAAASGIYTDALTPSSEVPTEVGDKVFLVTQPGTYTNFGNVVLPDNSFGFIFKNGNSFSLQSVEMPMQSLENVVQKKDISILGNIFKLENVVNDKYLNADGVITDSLGASYGFIDLSQDYNSFDLFIPASGGNGRRYVLLDANDNIINVVNTSQQENISVTYPTDAVKFVFTIEPANKTTVVDKSQITIYYEGTQQGVDFVKEILGKKILAGFIEDNEDNKEFVRSNGVVKRIDVGKYNLINPDNVRLNSTYSNEGYISNPSYHASEPIPITKDTEYYFNTISNMNNPVRTVRTIRENGTIIEQFTTAMNSFIPINSDSKYAVVSIFNTINPTDISMSNINEGFKQYKDEDEIIFELEEKQNASTPNSVITKEILEEKFESLDIDTNVKINISNSDKILYTGSSSIESFYSPDYKAWLNKLQDFIDWQIVPYGWSGQGANSIASKLQLDTPTQVAGGVKPSEINPTYVFLGQTLNSNDLIDDEFDTAFIESNENLLRSAVAVTGAKPIIGTAYRTENRKWIENSLKQLADKWGADFIPIGSYHMSMIRTGKYNGFYGNAHPAIRTHEAYTLPLLRYFNQLPRPKQGILLFEARNQNADVTDLSYKDNFKRAEKFRSIQVGEMALDSDYQDMYDRLNESGYTINKNNTSQYMKLLKKQEVVLSNKILIEIILPKVRTNEVVVDLVASNITNYYLYNTFTQQFESVNTLSIKDRKYIEFDKIKLLCVGSSISISDISVNVIGGVVKPTQSIDKINPPKAGELVIESKGFDDTTIVDWRLTTNERYNLTTKYGDDKFNDMPKYLGELKDVVKLNGILARDFNVSKGKSFGYRKLRVWTCARLYPKIYNPDAYTSWLSPNENPYTDISWYDKNKYDYDDLNVVVKQRGVSYENQCKSVNVQKVGLFWNLGYVDIELPISQDENFTLHIFRDSNNNDYPMEICDVSVELL